MAHVLRFTLSHLSHVALTLALLVSALNFPGLLSGFLWPGLPVIGLWADPDAQHRLQLEDVPYDLLRAADAVLPREAAVLLATSGHDVRHREYTTFHRALYFLAPRSTWWLAPAPPDGTWESRWWISAPLTPESISAIAMERGVSHVLVYSVAQPLPIGRRIAEWDDGYLLELSPAPDRSVIGLQRRVADSPGAVERENSYAGPFWPIQIACALAAIFALGRAVLAVIARSGYRTHGVESLMLAWVLGAGLTSLAMLALNALGLALKWQMVLLTLPVIGGLGWKSRHNTLRASRITFYVSRFTFYVSRFTPNLLLLSFFTLHLAFVTLLAVGRPLYAWDAWATWGMKARTIFLDGRIAPGVYLDPSRAVTHLDYPLLAPLVETWLYGWLNAPDDRFAGLVTLLFYLALAGACYSATRRRGGSRTYALAVTALAASIPRVALWAGLVFADVPLASLATIGAVYLIEWLEGGPPGALALAALAAGLMPWTKREGLVLLIALGLAALTIGWQRRRAWIAVGGLACAALLLAGPWWAFVAWKRIANTDFLPVTLTTFQANAGRLPTIARMALASLLSANWSYVWPLAALVAVGLFVRSARIGKSAFLPVRREQVRNAGLVDLLPLAAVCYLGLMCLAYVFSAYVPYQQHVASSLDRLIAHIVPFAVLWIAYRGIPQPPLSRPVALDD